MQLNDFLEMCRNENIKTLSDLEDKIKENCSKNIDFNLVEKIILQNVDEKYNWIVRDSFSNAVYLYENKPQKNENGFWNGVGCCFSEFNHLFKCVKDSDNKPIEFKKYI